MKKRYNELVKIRNVAGSVFVLRAFFLTLILIASLKGTLVANRMYIKASETENTIRLLDDKFYVCRGDEKLCGPFDLIISEGRYNDGVVRYIKNDRWGYLSVEQGRILTEPIFREASKMSDGNALVSEDNETIYYIDKTGCRFTKNYRDGFPFSEAQGCFARVQDETGKWSIINRQDRVLASGFDSINELPCTRLYGGGIRDNKAVIFKLIPYGYGFGDEEDFFAVVREYEGYIGLSYTDPDLFVVKNSEGRYGVVNAWDGEFEISAEYIDVAQASYVERDSEVYDETIMFIMTKEDGTLDLFASHDGGGFKKIED